MDNLVALNKLFQNRLFRIPDYQRGYSWEHRQIQEFLEDLEVIRPGRYHYTGTVVLSEAAPEESRMDEDGNSFDFVEIVDGQQRLTTIVLLLDGIRRELVNLSQTAIGLSRGIFKNYISAREMNGQLLYKLSLNDEDADNFFKVRVLADHLEPVPARITYERRLESAKLQIASYLQAAAPVDETAQEEWLLELYTKITTQLQFTLYQVQDEAEVGIVFEVMNDRGKPLTDLEKVKNTLLHTSTTLDVANDLPGSVNRVWGQVLRELMAADLVSSTDKDRLLRVDWLAHYNPQSRLWEGSKTVKAEFDPRKTKNSDHNVLLNRLHAYTRKLESSAVIFCDAHQPFRPGAFQLYENAPRVKAQVLEWSEKLNRLGTPVSLLPVLVAVRERWPEDPHKYLQMIKLCEIFAFRVYELQGSRTDAGQVTMFRVGYDLSIGSEDFGGAVARIKSELAYRCGSKEFARLTSEDNQQVSQAYSWRGLRYFLYEYEIFLAFEQGASPNVRWGELRRDLQDTIEHILPQSIEQLSYWFGRFGDAEHRRYLHDLGNLTLTKHNSYYGNKPFPDKKGAVDAEYHCYAKSPFYAERELSQKQHWDAITIEERRSNLLDWARRRWAVDVSEYEGKNPEAGPDEGPDPEV